MGRTLKDDSKGVGEPFGDKEPEEILNNQKGIHVKGRFHGLLLGSIGSGDIDQYRGFVRQMESDVYHQPILMYASLPQELTSSFTTDSNSSNYLINLPKSLQIITLSPLPLLPNDGNNSIIDEYDLNSSFLNREFQLLFRCRNLDDHRPVSLNFTKIFQWQNSSVRLILPQRMNLAGLAEYVSNSHVHGDQISTGTNPSLSVLFVCIFLLLILLDLYFIPVFIFFCDIQIPLLFQFLQIVSLLLFFISNLANMKQRFESDI